MTMNHVAQNLLLLLLLIQLLLDRSLVETEWKIGGSQYAPLLLLLRVLCCLSIDTTEQVSIHHTRELYYTQLGDV